MKKKKAVFNWSGGKDSALALYKTLQSGEYEVIALLTTVNSDTHRSTMHSIPLSLLQAQADSIGMPLYAVDLEPEGDIGKYDGAMRSAVEHFKAMGVTHFIFGDIFLHDVRSYREAQLNPNGIEVVEPLWNKTSAEIMEDFLASGLQTIVVTTMANLLDRTFIGRLIDRQFTDGLPEGVDVCGENGEYHTFCFAGPVFSYPVPYALGTPFQFSHSVGMADGTQQTFTYWFASLAE
jgi:uncharacterized protein (TIGR00290 family)